MAVQIEVLCGTDCKDFRSVCIVVAAMPDIAAANKVRRQQSVLFN
jgi:hypothetical protein